MNNSKIIILILAILSLTNCTSKQENKVSFYVGTYTNGDSEGIYKYQIDAEGKLTKIGLAAAIENPSFLAKTQDNKTLIAVSEVNKNGTGFVSSFRIKKDSLAFVNQSKSGGASPCYISVNEENQVLVANYSSGNVGYLNIQSDGKLSELLAVQQHVGNGITERQKNPHAHAAWFHPTKNEIISVDLGTNQLWFSSIDKSKNKFEFTAQKTLNFEAAAGPRHLVFHPNKKWMYVASELNNTVSLIKEKEGKYYIAATFAMLPQDFEETSYAADIHISKDGKFLYASNRGHNSIVIYKVNAKSGSLEVVGFEDVKGVNPRNFSLSPDNKFLVVANQSSNNLVSFKRDEHTGKLTFINEIAAPTPVCVLF